MLLEGEALASWLELSEEQQGDFKIVKEKLVGKMTPLSFTALEEFHAQKLCPGEALSLFTQDLKRLLQTATPGLDKKAGEQMLIHQFLTGLPTTISRQLCAIDETNELDKVVELALLLMTIDNQDPLHSVATTGTSSVPNQPNEVTCLMDQMESLMQQVAALTTLNSTNSRYRPGPV